MQADLVIMCFHGLMPHIKAIPLASAGLKKQTNKNWPLPFWLKCPTTFGQTHTKYNPAVPSNMCTEVRIF